MRIECEDSWLVCDEELMKMNNWTCWDEGIQKDCPKTCGLCSGKLSLLGFAIMIIIFLLIIKHFLIHHFTGEKSTPVTLSKTSKCPDGFHELRIYWDDYHTNMSHCAKLCDTAPKCKYFHYNKLSATYGQCTLFSTGSWKRNSTDIYCLKDSKHFSR